MKKVYINFFWMSDGYLHPENPLILDSRNHAGICNLFPVYGIFMKPIGWKLAGFVWIYAFVFFVINDFVKIRFDRLLDHAGIRFGRMQPIASN